MVGGGYGVSVRRVEVKGGTEMGGRDARVPGGGMWGEQLPDGVRRKAFEQLPDGLRRTAFIEG